MFEFLNQNSGALTVIFSAVVTISTVVYAVLTAKLVAETRRLREAQTEPRIEVRIQPREEFINILQLMTRNIGLGPAYDISFEVSATSEEGGAQILINDFTKPNYFRTGLKYLGPGQQLASGFTSMFNNFDQKIEAVLLVTVRYKNAADEKRGEVFRLDFSEFKGLTQVGTPHLYNIAQSLEKIQKDLHHIATGFNRIKVNSYDNEDRERERAEQEERHRRREQGEADIKDGCKEGTGGGEHAGRRLDD